MQSVLHTQGHFDHSIQWLPTWEPLKWNLWPDSHLAFLGPVVVALLEFLKVLLSLRKADPFCQEHFLPQITLLTQLNPSHLQSSAQMCFTKRSVSSDFRQGWILLYMFMTFIPIEWLHFYLHMWCFMAVNCLLLGGSMDQWEEGRLFVLLTSLLKRLSSKCLAGLQYWIDTHVLHRDSCQVQDNGIQVPELPMCCYNSTLSHCA